MKSFCGFLMILCVVLACFLVSCASLKEVRFDVDPSSLDYIQLVSHVSTDDGTEVHTVDVTLFGNG